MLLFKIVVIEKVGVARGVLGCVTFELLLSETSCITHESLDLSTDTSHAILVAQAHLCDKLWISHETLHPLMLLIVLLCFFILLGAKIVVHKHAHLLQLFDLLSGHGTPLSVHEVVQIDLTGSLVSCRQVDPWHVLLCSLNKLSVISDQHHRLIAAHGLLLGAMTSRLWLSGV